MDAAIAGQVGVALWRPESLATWEGNSLSQEFQHNQWRELKIFHWVDRDMDSGFLALPEGKPPFWEANLKIL